MHDMTQQSSVTASCEIATILADAHTLTKNPRQGRYLAGIIY
jgi:hypothetical protein